jgi:hypothetical protein
MFSSHLSHTRALRASDADRERVATALKDHAAEGRLSMDELGDRLGTCYGARTAGELDSLLWDLPAAAPAHPAPRPRAGSLRPVLVAIGVVLALTILPGIVFPVFGMAMAALALVLVAVLLLVPLVLVGAGAWGVARLVRGQEARRAELR